MKSTYIIKRYLIGSVTSLCLLFATQVHADFRKALDAYIARDGDTMIKEVKEAVDAKNDDGLMLLLMATNMDAATSDYDETTKQSKSTLRAILPQPKWDEIRELLVQATNNSTVDAQYYFLTSRQFGISTSKKIIEEYAKRGSNLAMLQSSVQNKAEANDMEVQLALAFRYLNYDNQYGCQKQSPDPLCQVKDEVKGNYWLKRAVRTYETSLSEDWDTLPAVMCDYYRNTANGEVEKLKQAYLWALKGVNEVGSVSSSNVCLRNLYESKEIKLVSPKLYEVWNDVEKRSSNIYDPNLKELPSLLAEVRKDSYEKELPVFIYRFDYQLDIYSSGKIFFGFSNNSNDLLRVVDPNVVKEFLSALKANGFYTWTSENFNVGHCSDFDNCGMLDMRVRLADGNTNKRFYMGLLNEKSQTLDWKHTNRQKMAIIKTLVEKYFPTQSLRCGLGNSEVRRKNCEEQDSNWLKISARVGRTRLRCAA